MLECQVTVGLGIGFGAVWLDIGNKEKGVEKKLSDEWLVPVSYRQKRLPIGRRS